MPLTSGQIFAGYTIIRLLGTGGMGEVYLAQHPRLPRRDALKLLPHDWSADGEYRARFNREADLASTLWHPHIVGVHDRGEEDGQLWISMDFVDGLDAARLLADRYPVGMPVEEVARIVTAVASALDYAHKQDLLHRDVKPANIMLTHLDDDGEQRVLLTDFGIARNVSDISGLTKTNMTVGTVAYSAPEQLLGEDVDGRADQYSLAATAFHLLTGSQLFPNSNPAVIISHHLNVPPPALADRRPELGKLDPILAKGLCKRPDDRYRRCSDFAQALSEQISSASVPTQAAPTSPTPAPPQRDRGDTKSIKARLSAAAAAVVAVILTAVLIVIWQPWERQSSPRPRESPALTTSLVPVPPQVNTTTSVEPPPPQTPTTPTLSPSQTRARTITPPAPSAAPDIGRIYNGNGGFSFVIPAGWVESDASHLDYGSEMLSKTTGQPPTPDQPPPVANDTRIILGRLDETLYASAEPNNAKAAVRLGSDMGEFFMPYPGNRINQATIPLTGANRITGSASYYEIKFSDTTKPTGEIWTGVVGSPGPNAASASPPQRWWLVWLGTSNDPVDRAAAKMLAESLRPLTL